MMILILLTILSHSGPASASANAGKNATCASILSNFDEGPLRQAAGLIPSVHHLAWIEFLKTTDLSSKRVPDFYLGLLTLHEQSPFFSAQTLADHHRSYKPETVARYLGELYRRGHLGKMGWKPARFGLMDDNIFRKFLIGYLVASGFEQARLENNFPEVLRIITTPREGRWWAAGLAYLDPVPDELLLLKLMHLAQDDDITVYANSDRLSTEAVAIARDSVGRRLDRLMDLNLVRKIGRDPHAEVELTEEAHATLLKYFFGEGSPYQQMRALGDPAKR